MNLDPSTTKYLILGKIYANGIVEKPDVVGAIFGQTEGLLGNELDLRDLQKSGRIGRIEVDINEKKGRSEGVITMPSSLDQIETAILASALETIDRVGPCKAEIVIDHIEDVRVQKKNKIVDRAKELLTDLMEESQTSGIGLAEAIRQSLQVQEIVHYGKEKCPAGPNVEASDAIIVVEGRNDVLNLLKFGIKNAIAVEGTNIPQAIQDLSKERIVTAFVDGDRGGELILREFLQVAEVDFVARAPKQKEVEELTQKQIMKALRNKVSAEQYIDMYGINNGGNGPAKDRKNEPKKPSPKLEKRQQMNSPKEREKKPASNLSTEQKAFKAKFNELAGKSTANFLDDKGVVLVETTVRDLAKTLKDTKKNVATLIFDGIVTQRIVDIAADKKIKTIVAGKAGGIAKLPSSITLYTKNDL